MRDVNNGWLIRYIHANELLVSSSFGFICMGERYIMVVIKLLEDFFYGILVYYLFNYDGYCFLRLCITYGTKCRYRAMVITNLLSVIGGSPLVYFIWGNFTV
jgi:ubiquinol-cytochrome c reductase cytochrome b subunit